MFGVFVSQGYKYDVNEIRCICIYKNWEENQASTILVVIDIYTEL